MTLGFIVILILGLIAIVVVLLKLKNLPKLFAFFLITMLIFVYFSFNISISGKYVDFRNPSGWVEAGGIYLSWLSSTFQNAKSITLHAISLDWKPKNESIKNSDLENESIWEKLK
ncbi:hypothetical protein COU58_03260 [Candidatus Pacearchaeota archaeon CG10_big_fil_rev_8_21_14_0_10_32_42]|nr:MAG: hypothetical protein COU58_03260 [Candidatus Pacearchaeota archaeon CG10_big_fil_rev_8_21_14_0_10_32_42]